jgi:hypothetical protein
MRVSPLALLPLHSASPFNPALRQSDRPPGETLGLGSGSLWSDVATNPAGPKSVSC